MLYWGTFVTHAFPAPSIAMPERVANPCIAISPRRNRSYGKFGGIAGTACKVAFSASWHGRVSGAG
jgi:hypothetical protein